ncbi:hypothetical protein GCM10022398_00730 [Acetobacter lovaniensis]
MPPADHTQKLHVNHSKNPPENDAGECEGMGQISMKISALPGSVLSENQHVVVPDKTFVPVIANKIAN